MSNNEGLTSEKSTQNSLFPVFLKLEQLKVLIVGGGNVALEKLNALLMQSPATQIVLVAPVIQEEIITLSKHFFNLTLEEREFSEGDLNGNDLIIVATDKRELSIEIKALAKAKKILCNVADTPDLCDFYLSSVVHKGDLKIAISTNGKSPTAAKRLKQVLDESIPSEIDQLLSDLNKIRNGLKGDFSEKVRKMNEITATLVEKQSAKKEPKYSWKAILMAVLGSIGLMIVGHILFSYVPFDIIYGYGETIIAQVDSDILYFILGGFIAQMIDGALGMAYGVSASTFLLTFGIPPAAVSMSVHTSEIFTSGVSGLMHLKFRNVNSKLFKVILLPGIIGAIVGAYILSSFEEYNYIIKPVVGVYTLFLGVLIIRKVLQKNNEKKKVKKIGVLASAGGFLDSIGGGGWGPIVSSTLIASGRNPRYTVGSVNLAEFFVSLASSITFMSIIGLGYWQVIAGLILGGVIAAPIAAMLSKKLSIKTMMIMVGVIVIIVSLRIIIHSAIKLF